jgi:small subunit ribosomal protein S4
MPQYTGPRLKLVRRLGTWPGLTSKQSQKDYLLGEHSHRPRKLSQYAVRLIEKQKLRFNYGLSERQLTRYVSEARRQKKSTGEALLELLEMRLDNIVFRLGFAPTIPAARQLVNHGDIQLNGRLASYPNYACRPGDVITVKEHACSRAIVMANVVRRAPNFLPEHLELDGQSLTGRVTAVASRNSMLLLINELLVVEYYSRRL